MGENLFNKFWNFENHPLAFQKYDTSNRDILRTFLYFSGYSRGVKVV